MPARWRRSCSWPCGGASIVFFAVSPRDDRLVAQALGPFLSSVLMLPSFAAGVLIGWSRRTRGAPAGLVAALASGILLLALGQAGLALAGRAGASGTPPPGLWGPLILRVFEVALVASVGLAASAAGWFLGRLPWSARSSSPLPPGIDAGVRQQDEAAKSVG